mmetsp:Transcript_54072/g.115472  ORF Transcript_54072/g.115472 Transcript_54072/m.115472 type:complete len:215 (-) Transcript_54072:255-899(-)
MPNRLDRLMVSSFTDVENFKVPWSGGRSWEKTRSAAAAADSSSFSFVPGNTQSGLVMPPRQLPIFTSMSPLGLWMRSTQSSTVRNGSPSGPKARTHLPNMSSSRRVSHCWGVPRNRLGASLVVSVSSWTPSITSINASENRSRSCNGIAIKTRVGAGSSKSLAAPSPEAARFAKVWAKLRDKSRMAGCGFRASMMALTLKATSSQAPIATRLPT